MDHHAQSVLNSPHTPPQWTLDWSEDDWDDEIEEEGKGREKQRK